MTLQTGIATALRNAGLDVDEVPGWRARGSASFAPHAVMFHHTASNPGKDAPSLDICIHGRPGIPGPLCNVLIGRDGTCHVIAAGRANHAGAGGWRGLAGNSSILGIEVEHAGTDVEKWADTLLDTTARACRALLAMIGRDASWLCGHKEWTTRKIDPWRIDMDHFRDRVAALTPGPTTPPPTEEVDVSTIIKGDKRAEWWATDGTSKAHLVNRDVVNNLVFVGALKGKGGEPEPHVLPQAIVDSIPTVTSLASLAETEVRLAKILAGGGTGLTATQAREAAAGAIRDVLGSLDE